MIILLDTYIAIWALNDDPALSEKARELIVKSTIPVILPNDFCNQFLSGDNNTYFAT